MRKYNPTRYSSAVGEVWVMLTFKVKYCHAIFDIVVIRAATERLLREALKRYDIQFKDIGFDNNHVHLNVDLGISSKPELAKKLKGYIARKLFMEHPWLKKKYFWGSGLWSPAYDGRGGDMEFYGRYVRGQKYGTKDQTKLTAF